MAEAKRDQNRIPTLLGVSSADGTTPVTLYADPITHRLYVDLTSSSSGTVTKVSVVTANGISGTVATDTTTPAITLSLGDITPSKINGNTVTTGTGTLTLGSYTLTVANTASVSGTNTGDQDFSEYWKSDGSSTATDDWDLGTHSITASNFTGSSSGINTGDNSANSLYSGLASSKADVGQTFYIGTTQVAINRASNALTLAGLTLTTPNIGAATATSINGNTITSGTGTITITGTKTLTVSDTASVSGTNTGDQTLPTRSSLGLDTDNSPQFAGINLGSASDTTIARVSAGVISVDGVTIPTISSTSTLTNKRVTSRVTSITSHATPTINTDDCDAVDITALAEAITSMTTNLTGTPTNFQKLIIRFKDNGTAYGITWGTSFIAGGVPLPTTTVLSKILTVGFIYNTANSLNKWQCVASNQEA